MTTYTQNRIYSLIVPRRLILGRMDGFNQRFIDMYVQGPPTAGELKTAYDSNREDNPVVPDIKVNKYKGELTSTIVRILGDGSNRRKRALIIERPRLSIEGKRIVAAGGVEIPYEFPPDGFIERYFSVDGIETCLPESTSPIKTKLTRIGSENSYSRRGESEGDYFVIRHFNWYYCNDDGPFSLDAYWGDPFVQDSRIGFRSCSESEQFAGQNRVK